MRRKHKSLETSAGKQIFVGLTLFESTQSSRLTYKYRFRSLAGLHLTTTSCQSIHRYRYRYRRIQLSKACSQFRPD